MQNNLQMPADTGVKIKTIGEMSVTYGVSLRTLRFYEDKGLIRPKRLGTQRLYGAMDEVRLQIILKGKRLGFSLCEIENFMLAAIDPNQAIDEIKIDQTAVGALTPALLQSKIQELEKRHHNTNEAIAELSRRLQ